MIETQEPVVEQQEQEAKQKETVEEVKASESSVDNQI